VAQQALDEATSGPEAAEVNAARLQVDQGEIPLEQSRFNLQLTEDTLAEAELVAPGSGTVLSVEVALGAIVGAGTSVVTLLGPDRLEFQTTTLSERDLAQIVPGQAAEVTLKAYPDVAIEARVVRVGVQAGPAAGDAATFPVYLAFGETDLDICPGMTGRVEIRSEN
jgi:HlyD family secretion protein